MKRNLMVIIVLCMFAVVVSISGCTNLSDPTRSSSTNLTGIVVNPGQSIQSAIDGAPVGSNVIVNSGNYSELLNIKKNITLIGNGTVYLSEVNISANGTTLQGFTISGNYPVKLFSTSDVRIINNTIYSVDNGIMDTGTNKNLLVEGNTLIGTNPLYGNNMAFEGVTNNAVIKDNNLSGAQHGILFDKASTNNIISGNTIKGNVQLTHTEAGALDHEGTAIYTVDGSTNFQILNNKVTYERDGIAVQQLGNLTASGFIISGNICTNNLNAMWITVSDSLFANNTLTNNNEGIDLTGTGNIIKSNTILNNTSVGIAITSKKSTDSNTVIENTMSGNHRNFYTAGPGIVLGI